MHTLRKLLTVTAVIIPIVFLTGCFQILHFLQLNADRSIDVRWRFTISRGLQEMGKQNQSQAAESGDSGDLMTKLNSSNGDLQKRLGNRVRNLSSRVTQTDKDVVMEVSFKTNEYINAPSEEMFDLMPSYNATTKQLAYHFRPEKKDEQKPAADEKPGEAGQAGQSGPGAQASGEEEGNPGEQIAKMIMGSARYNIVLAGEYKPTAAYVLMKNGKKADVVIQTLGPLFYIDFPFMSYLMEAKEGFDLIVQLR